MTLIQNTDSQKNISIIIEKNIIKVSKYLRRILEVKVNL